MNTRIFALAALVATTALGGCAKQTFDIAGNGSARADLEESQHFFIHGVFQDSSVDAAEVCDGVSNVARVEVEQSAVGVVLAVLTYNLYTPRTARVYCVK